MTVSPTRPIAWQTPRAEAAENAKERFRLGVLGLRIEAIAASRRPPAAAVASACAYKKGNDEGSELNESIILTGHHTAGTGTAARAGSDGRIAAKAERYTPY
ncbi:hypothetical protein P4050_30555 [Pseudomonas aeruginosa]|nr:hypothetical protein [Pseudomonas aeruginosa]